MSLQIDSHYARTITEARAYPALTVTQEVETCVIGGGLAGLAAALDLAERGRPVVLLEANGIGWGASGRNGGFASPGFPGGLPDLVEKVGLADAQTLTARALAAHQLLRARIARYNIDCGPIIDGQIRCEMASATPSLEAYCAWSERNFGLKMQYWPKAKVRAVLATERYADAFFNPYTFSVHTLNLARGLARAITEQGGSVHEQSKVQRITRAGAAHVVHTAHGTITARNVVLACGGYIGRLVPRLGDATVPIATFVMVTEPLGDRLTNAIALPHAVSDIKFATNYYRPLADTRLLWGGRVLAWEPSPARIAAALHRDMASFYPGLASARVAVAWGGRMPYLKHKMVDIGQIEPGLWYATGFGGLGVSITTLAGEMIGAAIAENDDRWRMLNRFGLPYAGGQLGRIPAQLIYWRRGLEARFGRGKNP